MLQRITVCLLLVVSVLLPLDAHASTIQLPATGQTACYNAAGGVVACTGTGQDGDKKKGAALPSPRFTDNGNGTVTDNLTGLVWLKNANCFGTQTWANALTSANTLVGNNTQCGGLNDSSTAGQWRLPNRKELQSLVDRSGSNPALPVGHPFTDVQADNYWSSSTHANYTGLAWYVDMYFGHVVNNLKTSVYYVWPVRSGQ